MRYIVRYQLKNKTEPPKYVIKSDLAQALGFWFGLYRHKAFEAKIGVYYDRLKKT